MAPTASLAPDDLLWYVAYGSNVHADRFNAYVSGGRPEGAARRYPGCRDATPPRAVRPVRFGGRVFFALNSTVWAGGMAFYDPSLPDSSVAGRAYLVTLSQFSDIVHQEMHRPVGADLELGPALRDGRARLGPGRYETIVRLDRDPAFPETDHPAFTFTCPSSAELLEDGLRPPSEAYVRTIATGLRDAHRWDAKRIAKYLWRSAGIEGWSKERLLKAVRATGPRDRSH